MLGYASTVSLHPDGEKVWWWAFSSCTTKASVLSKTMFLGDTGKRTLFHIAACKAVEIERQAAGARPGATGGEEPAPHELGLEVGGTQPEKSPAATVAESLAAALVGRCPLVGVGGTVDQA